MLEKNSIYGQQGLSMVMLGYTVIRSQKINKLEASEFLIEFLSF